MCRADEFLRISSFFILETRAKRIRSVGEYAALGGNCAAAIFEAAVPDSGSFSVHVLKSPLGAGSRVRGRMLGSLKE